MTTEHLRLIYATQSIGMGVFWNLHQALSAEGGVGRCGFFVTNHYEYALFERSNPDFLRADLDIRSEWDLLEEARRLGAPDLADVEEWERRIGDASLWNALIIDRRLNFRLKAQFVQSYEPSYRHEELLKILQVALNGIAAQFDHVKPHAVVGLNAVTLYDYLYYLMARQRRIPYFQLKLTRVRNYVSLYTDPFDLSPHIAESFQRFAGGSLNDADREALADARALLAEVRDRGLVYEGAIRRTAAKDNPAEVHSSRPRLGERLRRWMDRLKVAFAISDPHYPTLIQSVWYLRILRPLRRRFMRWPFDIDNADTFVRNHEGRYALYPLNTEPEVALLAFGRPYRNQIETLRNLAASLPVGWKLVVKEHPSAHGYRSTAFYRKLRQIPNVLLAAPRSDTGRLIDGSSLVALVFGTIGLEAVIKRKPIVILCHTPYAVFPRTMVRYVDNLWQLGAEIRDLLAKYQYQEPQVEAFLAAHIRTGIRLNLFTGLLGKGGRETVSMDNTMEQQYAELARYTRQRIAEEQARLAV